MRNWFTNERFQPLVIVERSDVPKLDTPNQTELKDADGNTYITANITVHAAANVSSARRPERLLQRKTFSSVPLFWQSEISEKYSELGEALGEMTRLEEGDELKIDAEVQQVACQVSGVLWANSYPAPRIFNHGPKSVVFNWTHGENSLYLTISSDYISALTSTPERINQRIGFSTKNLLNPALMVRGLLPPPPGQLIFTTSSSASKISEPVP